MSKKGLSDAATHRQTKKNRDYNRRSDVRARKLAWARNDGDRSKKADAEKIKKRQKNYDLRFEALIAYAGGKNPPECMCECGCKENRPLILDIDHVNNDGPEHRRYLCEGAGGNNLYRKLKKLGWPNKEYPLRVLCIKCNVGRQRNGGQCVEIGILPIGINRKPPKNQKQRTIVETPFMFEMDDQ
jgi:hypothetical protein